MGTSPLLRKHSIEKRGKSWLVLAQGEFVTKFRTRDEARIFLGRKPAKKITGRKER